MEEMGYGYGLIDNFVQVRQKNCCRGGCCWSIIYNRKPNMINCDDDEF